MEDAKKMMEWALVACSLRVVLDQILHDIDDNKIVIKPSSKLTPIGLKSRMKEIDDLVFKLLPNSKQPLEELQTQNKGKKLN